MHMANGGVVLGVDFSGNPTKYAHRQARQAEPRVSAAYKLVCSHCCAEAAALTVVKADRCRGGSLRLHYAALFLCTARY